MSNSNIFLAGDCCDLVVLSEDLAKNSSWFTWFNDAESTRETEHHRFPNTISDQVRFFQHQVVGNSSNLILGIAEKSEGSLVGVISLSEINPIDRKAKITIMIGEAEFRNASVATEAHQMIIAHAFNELNLNRIYGASMTKEWAEFLCRAIGFKMEGLLRQEIYKRGRYHDVYQFAILRDHFDNLAEEAGKKMKEL